MTNQRSTGNHRLRLLFTGMIPILCPGRAGWGQDHCLQSDRYPNGDHLQV